jgi:phage regulator Rha-like protein
MNELVNITQGHALTMSTLEIAGLASKRHKNVLADARKMVAELGLSWADFSAEYKDSTGRTLVCAKLPKRETMILVTGYSVALRARVIDRWQELENMIAAASHQPIGTVTDLAAEVRNAIGGIVKGIVHKEMTETIPALVSARLAEQAFLLRHGKTSGQIWKANGFPPIRVNRWFSDRLCAMGCQIEGGGKGELGLNTAKLFDPDKAELWLRNGGKALVEAKIAERKGQTSLRLIAGRAAS